MFVPPGGGGLRSLVGFSSELVWSGLDCVLVFGLVAAPGAFRGYTGCAPVKFLLGIKKKKKKSSCFWLVSHLLSSAGVGIQGSF